MTYSTHSEQITSDPPSVRENWFCEVVEVEREGGARQEASEGGRVLAGAQAVEAGEGIMLLASVEVRINRRAGLGVEVAIRGVGVGVGEVIVPAESANARVLPWPSGR